MSRRGRRLAAQAIDPPVSRDAGYPEERLFVVGHSHLTHQFSGTFVHPIIEIGLILSGRGSLHLNGVDHELHAGDGYFLDMGQPHRHDPDGATTGIFVHVKYEALSSIVPRDEYARLLQPFLFLQAGAVPPVLRGVPAFGALVREALRRYSSSDPYAYARAWASVVEAFAEIARACERTAHIAVTPGALARREVVAKALHFIGVNATAPIKLSQIASYCSLSPSRLSAVFRETMRVSPIEYRNRIRINRAVEMLRSSGKTAQQVAYECGFNSMAQFRLLIKRHTRATPRELRVQ